LVLSLLTTWRTFVILNLLGAIAGYLLFTIITGQTNISFESNNQGLIVYHYGWSIMMCYFAIYTKEQNAKTINKVKDKLYTINNQLQNKIERKTKYLKSILNAKEKFLSNISHEMRAPMQGIYGIAEELKDNWHQMSEEQKIQYIQLIAQGSERLTVLFCDLLDLSKLNANKMNMNFELYDVQDLIHHTIQDLNTLSVSKRIPIIFHRNININSIAIVDKIRISQVIRNLISNALKYSSEGQIIISVDYLPEETKNKNKKLIITIKDEGVGIPEHELNIIFLPFIQSSKTNRGSGGTGLGLSICAEIIQLHKGKIWASNNETGGSSFFFTLPSNTNLNSHKKSSQEVISYINNLGSVLILDDDYLSIESGKIILSSIGFNVITATNTADCLEKLANNSIAILFLDMMMPDMSGAEFLKILRKNPNYAKLNVILMSGVYDAQEVQESFNAGALHHFNKPYNKTQIAEGLTQLFQNIP
jgi:two-component system CheB/CheR fusion protein